jgi:hypothetical protein
LERYQLRRRVSLYYRLVYVSDALAPQEVEIHYESTSHMWVIQRLDGRGIKSVPAVEVERDAIMRLAMYAEAKAKRRGNKG